ncbi:MAG: transcription-repair coupling factor [Pirellulaceae bacterium]|nr:transcription-repair coupling factor [Pirellulaceae bacterium]
MLHVTPHAIQKARLIESLRRWTQSTEFQFAVAALWQHRAPCFSNVWGSSLAGLVSTLRWYATENGQHQPLLIVCDTDKQMDVLADELLTFGLEEPQVTRFPTIEATQAEKIPSDWAYGQRLQLSQTLREDAGTGGVLLASVASLMQTIPSHEELEARQRCLCVDSDIDMDELCRWLTDGGIQPVTLVEHPGEYSRRGGVVDVFPPNAQRPFRIEWFDTTIESIRQFDLTTQRSTERQATALLQLPLIESQSACCLLDWLPEQTAVCLVDPQEAQAEGRRHEVYGKSPIPNLKWDDVRQRMARCCLATIELNSFDDVPNQYVLPVQPLENFQGDLGDLRLHLDNLAKSQEVFLLTPIEGELERLTEIISSTHAAATGKIHLVVGECVQGFRDTYNQLAVVSCDEVFRRGELRRGRGRAVLGRRLDSFLDLQPGDLVVHLAHGIGRFRGLALLDKDNVKQEHLCLEFDGGTKLYVPATRMDLVQRYVGGTKKSPALARLGGKAWLKQRAAAEEAIQDMAAEMLQVQAQRAAMPGITFGPDTHWQAEFEQSFPYEETADQLTAIADIKGDMHDHHPMDRLLCGDVGFGKTEVAMRAAFKAVENGYQVALMVPTTVLAEQHFQTFRRRMSSFPLEIHKLSRFCSRKEQKETLEGLKSVRLDICIGTHRLAGKDVKFQNLGLLVIDEEQKFGVAVKERLKAMRHSVDILTLSATPIPRTLHLSLVGVRNISNLETPPRERLSVETRLTRFQPELFRDAILRELNRGGQAYFIHNRISDIFSLRDRLQDIVPEAKFAVGHGQMDAEELETVMTEFVSGKYDVLLATTIVESGLDIPNANTIFIDQSDRYGLADLHQLRGRVGRYKHQAYCYLLIDPNIRLKTNASKRLQAIQHYSELGAGFSIAMRDLEIRGAGNLLGTEQSGHIAAIGYELYCQLLERAVRQLKKEPLPMSVEVDVRLPGRGFLPDDYVDDRRLKIDIYRRVARVETFRHLEEMQEELIDRFGPLPSPVVDLFQRLELKLDAAIWEISSVGISEKFLFFEYRNRARMQQLQAMKRSRLRIVDDGRAFWPLEDGYDWTPERLLKLAKKILRPEAV